MINLEARMLGVQSLPEEEEVFVPDWLPEAFEPHEDPPEQEAVIILGTALGEVFPRYLYSVDAPALLRRQVEITVLLDTGLGETSHRPFEPSEGFPMADFPQISLKQYAHTNEAILGCPTLETTRKHGASKGRPFDEDKKVIEQDGDPTAQIPKPAHSFALLIEPE